MCVTRACVAQFNLSSDIIIETFSVTTILKAEKNGEEDLAFYINFINLYNIFINWILYKFPSYVRTIFFKPETCKLN